MSDLGCRLFAPSALDYLHATVDAAGLDNISVPLLLITLALSADGPHRPPSVVARYAWALCLAAYREVRVDDVLANVPLDPSILARCKEQTANALERMHGAMMGKTWAVLPRVEPEDVLDTLEAVRAAVL
jgi:hypothetical protein